MRIRYPNGNFLFFLHHVLVVSARIWSLKAQSPQVRNQVFAFNRTYMRHQATSPTDSSMPSTTGNGKLRETRNKIHPSSTSTNSSRHASSVSALAQTPSKPAISP